MSGRSDGTSRTSNSMSASSETGVHPCVTALIIPMTTAPTTVTTASISPHASARSVVSTPSSVARAGGAVSVTARDVPQ